MANRISSIRRQLQGHSASLQGPSQARSLLEACGSFIARLDELEEKLHNPRAEVVYDILAQKGGAGCIRG